MKIPPFKLERYFAQYEFKVRYLLSPSDCESLALSELLAMAGAESRALWDELRLSYTESQGHPRLRAEISRLYENLLPNQILTAVPEEAIFVLMNTLLRPGDQVIALTPAYQSLYEIAAAIGCQVIPWQIEPISDGWRLDLDWLADHLSTQTRLLVVNFPHNPTGYLPAVDEFQAIIDLVRRSGVYLFCDEMYRGLEYDPSQRLPAAADQYERGISLSGLSKTYALPGLRLGWLAMQDAALQQAVFAFKDYTTICHSAPSEILGIALENGQRIIDRNLAIIRNNLATAGWFFTRHQDIFKWLPPRTGSVAFPRWRGSGSVEEFCQAALDHQGIMIVPGSIFDFPGDYFRIGLGRKIFGEAVMKVESELYGNA
jgi:aspartate/methionine/tyrosine aminotransferase